MVVFSFFFWFSFSRPWLLLLLNHLLSLLSVSLPINCAASSKRKIAIFVFRFFGSFVFLGMGEIFLGNLDESVIFFLIFF